MRCLCSRCSCEHYTAGPLFNTVSTLATGVRAELVLGVLERKLGRAPEQAHEYLRQRLRYDGDQRLMDPGDKAVMMAWEGCAARLSCTYTLQEVWAG